MTLDLDSNVVYAILITIVVIVLVVNLSKIIRIRMLPKQEIVQYEIKPTPYDQERTQVPWPSDPDTR